MRGERKKRKMIPPSLLVSLHYIFISSLPLSLSPSHLFFFLFKTEMGTIWLGWDRSVGHSDTDFIFT
jgi:hypothetical protein